MNLDLVSLAELEIAQSDAEHSGAFCTWFHLQQNLNHPKKKKELQVNSIKYNLTTSRIQIEQGTTLALLEGKKTKSINRLVLIEPDHSRQKNACFS